MTDLLQRGIEIILRNQSLSGAYVACPNFPTYQYSWFRDGSFIAYSMDCVGRYESAARFHQWAASAINKREEIVGRAIAKSRQGERLSGADILHTRYSLDGSDDSADSWPNFQLDGFGTWLWALEEHRRLSKTSLPEEWSRAANLAASYLTALWQQPCYDCWEEFPDKIHTYTLAAIYGGLHNHSAFSGIDHRQTLEGIKRFLCERATFGGHFVKFIGSEEVDASLVGLAVPFGVVSVDDPMMRATVSRIETALKRGGVHRYASDTYYGGGEWVLLTAWLGWYYTHAGDGGKVSGIIEWIESQADKELQLPEQVPVTLNDPSMYMPWRNRWGEIARPLLWSHAKYIILRAEDKAMSL